MVGFAIRNSSLYTIAVTLWSLDFSFILNGTNFTQLPLNISYSETAVNIPSLFPPDHHTDDSDDNTILDKLKIMALQQLPHSSPYFFIVCPKKQLKLKYLVLSC